MRVGGDEGCVREKGVVDNESGAIGVGWGVVKAMGLSLEET